MTSMVSYVPKIYLLCLFVVVSQCATSKKWKKHSIVPDVIDVAPPKLLQAYYPGGVSVNLGNKLTSFQVKDQPTLKWDANDGLYTLIMTDPDAPSRQNRTFAEVRHWIVGNIRGNNVAGGDCLVDYIGAAPPQHTGLHRYIFLVFKQNGRIVFDEQRISKTLLMPRIKWLTKVFVKKYNLQGPVAGNFFYTEYDDYVPIYFSKFTDVK